MDISAKKPSQDNDIVVSVCVITYNHEKYIAQCLENIVAQECGFAYEVVVRDDCSTDGTRDIVELFCDRYPKLFRLIHAEENIGANRNLLKVFEHSRGQYIALCEGDDYWLDKKKLQIQIDAMREHPGVMFCSHACRLHGKDGLGEVTYLKGSHDFSETTCADVLKIAGQFAPTASYVLSKDVIQTLPAWFADAPVGDFFLEMYGIAAGRGLHLNKAMSAYRVSSENSWSTQNNERNAKKLMGFSQRMTHCLSRMAENPIFRPFDFSRKYAASQFNTAVGALLIGDYSVYKSAISDCWRTKPMLSLTQSVLYGLRLFPNMARRLYLFKRGRSLA